MAANPIIKVHTFTATDSDELKEGLEVFLALHKWKDIKSIFQVSTTLKEIIVTIIYNE